MHPSFTNIISIVIAIAMEAEAAPFIQHLSLQPVPDFFPATTPFLAYQGTHHQCNLTVITNGKDMVHGTGVDNVGTIPAALSTYLALSKLNSNVHHDSLETDQTTPKKTVDLLINAGTCGGFKKMGAEIGDVYLTTSVAHHDRRIPIPSFTDYGIGKIQSTQVINLASSINAKMGVCTTGNSLDAHDMDHFHMDQNQASVKDMEAAAIAWSCELHQTPHFGLKVVTDIVDGDKPTQEEFLENLHTAAESLQEALPKAIEYICGKGHDEL
jgi:5'-methylthioadenosine nucleosidase